MMKRTQARSSRPLSWVIAVMLLVGFASTVHAEDQDSSGTCSNASLKGSYGFYRMGNTANGPLAAIGIISFDGKGNNTATQSISRNGDIEFDVTFPGVYTVDPDCTGKGFTTDGVEFARLVVIDHGKGFYILSESAGNAVYGVGTKIH